MMLVLLLPCVLVVLFACADPPPHPPRTETETENGGHTETTPVVVDGDGDGFAADEDCDDDDPTQYPGAYDPMDGYDQDCDGTDGTGEPLEDGPFGSLDYASLGVALAIGDLDADGCDELLAGAPGWTSNAPYGVMGTSQLLQFAGCGVFDEPDLVRAGNHAMLGQNVGVGELDGEPVVLALEYYWNGGRGAVHLFPADYTASSSPTLSIVGTVAESASSASLLGSPAEWLLIGSQGGIDWGARFPAAGA